MTRKKEIIDCITIANGIKEELKGEISKLKTAPTFLIIQVGDVEASTKYVNNKIKDCNDVGIKVNKLKFTENITEDELINRIIVHSSMYHAVMVQLPLPSHINSRRVLDYILPFQDVDGLSTKNIGKLHSGQECLAPCTPSGVIEILKHINYDLTGKDVLVIGRSDIVGKPMAELLTQSNATVTLAHSKSNLQALLSFGYDVIISAIGKPKFLQNVDADILIDVGINFDENGKMCGDFDLETCEYNYASPVPRGVGLLTRALLLKNVYNTAKEQIEYNEKTNGDWCK